MGSYINLNNIFSNRQGFGTSINVNECLQDHEGMQIIDYELYNQLIANLNKYYENTDEALKEIENQLNNTIDTIMSTINEKEEALRSEMLGKLNTFKDEIMQSVAAYKNEIDTTLNELIESNNNFKNECNEKLDNLENRTSSNIVYVSECEGNTDNEKLQKAFDTVKSLEHDHTIIIDKPLTLTRTININKKINGYKTIVKGNGNRITLQGSFNFFSSHSEYTTRNAGDVCFKEIEFLGDGEPNLINGDRLIRIEFINCSMYYIKSIVYSADYTQSIYVKDCFIFGASSTNAILFNTENNYDLRITDNRIEEINSFFTFSACNGAYINNNLIEGIKGFTVKAKQNAGCQALEISNNYFELNGSYLDFTELKGYGLKVSNNYFHESDTNKVMIYLPVYHYGGNHYQDKYLFDSNVCGSGAYLFDFKQTPQSEIRIMSNYDYGKIKSNANWIYRNGLTRKETNSVGSVIYYDGVTKTITHNTSFSENLTEGKIMTYTIDLGEKLTFNDVVTVQLNGGGNNFTDGAIQSVMLTNYCIENNGTRIKVVVKASGSYIGDVVVGIKINVLKQQNVTSY